MRKAAFCIFWIVLGMLLFGAGPGAAAPRYTWIDLTAAGAPDISGVYPAAIDAAGEVVGKAYPKTSAPALLNRGGARPTPLAIHPTSGEEIPFAYLSGPFGIPIPLEFSPPAPNKGWEAQNLGRGGKHMAGRWWDTSYKPHAWVGQRGGSANFNLGTLGGTQSWGTAVNDSGQVAGAASTASGFAEAFLYSGGTMKPLGKLPIGGSSEARGINNAGQVVGGSGHAFLYDGTMHDLGTLKAPYNAFSDAYAINEAGQVVGESDIPYDTMPMYHAFLWDGGPEMKDLGTLPGHVNSRAYDINNLGQVVGYSATWSDVHAFLYTGGVMHDLNDLVLNLPAGLVLVIAHGINDRGQIIASANSNNHGYLLTPVSAQDAVDLLLQ